MSAEKLLAAALEKIEARMKEVNITIMQLNAETMQGIGEKYVQFKSEYHGLAQAKTLLGDAYSELIGAEPDKKSEPEQQRIY